MNENKTKLGYHTFQIKFGKIEEIPEEWDEKLLDFFLKINMGQSPPSQSYNKDKDGIVFLQGVTEFGEMYPETNVWCTDPKKIADSNEILFSVRAPVGMMNLSKIKTCIGRGLASLKPKKDYDLKYCYYLLQYLHNRFIPYSQGTTYDAINQGDLSKVTFPFTENILEQQKIGVVLSNIDSLIQKQEDVIGEKNNFMKGLMQKLLTVGIETDREMITTYPYGNQFQKFDIPKNEWSYDELENLCELITDGSHYSPSKEGDYPLATVENMNDSRIDIESCYKINKFDFEKLVKGNCEPEKNDVLFSKDGTIGLCLVYNQPEKIVLLSSIAIIRTKKDELEPIFCKYVLKSRYMEVYLNKIKSGTALKRIILKNLSKFKIPKPPLPEQEKIGKILSNMDLLLSHEIEYKEKLKQMKTGLMQQLLTGQKRVKV